MRFEQAKVKVEVFLSRVIAFIARRIISGVIKVVNPIVRLKDPENPYSANINLTHLLSKNICFIAQDLDWTAPSGFFIENREIISASRTTVDLKLWNIFIEKRKLIAESNSWGYEYLMRNPVPRPPLFTRNFKPTRGTEPVILSSNGFYHWLIEDLPKTLQLLETLNNPLLVHLENPPRYVSDFVKLSGLNNIALPRFITFEELKFITSNSSTGWPIPADIEILRTYFRKNFFPINDDLKVYIPRLRDTRSPNFEEELVKRLESEGWTIFDAAKHSFSEQISMFSAAREVAGVHGAGLSAATWMSPGTRLHEISPERNVRCYSRLCSINEINYNRIVYSQDESESENVFKSIVLGIN
jgi:hypothetical protein